MRAAWLWATIIGAMPLATQADERAAAAVVRLDVHGVHALKDALLTLAQTRLQSSGLVVDGRHAWLGLSGPLPATGVVDVRPGWSDEGMPPLPLAFEVWPRSPAASSSVATHAAIRATLAVPLLREVQVATRRLRKGSNVTCADLGTQLRDIRRVPKLVLPAACEIHSDAVALRDIAAGDIMRAADIGEAPDVTAGAPVRLSVAMRGITVSTTATALADARAGDQIDVRLRHPARTLRAHVTGPGAAQLMDMQP